MKYAKDAIIRSDLFFKGGELNSSRLDEVNGLYGSGLLDIEDFWLQYPAKGVAVTCTAFAFYGMHSGQGQEKFHGLI
jgi:hypothetical protein